MWMLPLKSPVLFIPVLGVVMVFYDSLKPRFQRWEWDSLKYGGLLRG